MICAAGTIDGARAVELVQQLPGRWHIGDRPPSARAGGLYAILWLRHFRTGAIVVFIPLVTGAPRRARPNSTASMDPRAAAISFSQKSPGELLDRREPPVFLLSDLRCGPIDGARAVELFGRYRVAAHRRRPPAHQARGALRHPLASTFPAGAIVVFIPWCRGAERPLPPRT